MDVCDSLIKWMQTFSVANPCKCVDDLLDGVTIAQVLHQISPKFYSTTWVEKVKSDIAANDWRLKVSNLKKIVKGIVDFYADVVGQQINDIHMPDVNAIGEHGNPKELGRLLQLVLGCAVNCDDKHEYIRRIMNMEESVQHDVMKAIQDLMTKDMPNTPEPADEQTKKLVHDLQKMSDQKDAYAQRCHDLDLQVVLLQEEKSNLISEIDRLNERLNQADSLDDPSSWKDWSDVPPSSVAGRRYLQLQKQAEQFQEELFRVETSRDEFRIKAEVLQKEIIELQEKNEELESSAEETRQLKDELDILRHTADKVSRYEATIASYKKKLEEMSDLKGQLKILESNNMEYMQKNLDLEEEVKKGDVLKTQLEAYRRQVQDLQLKLTDETKRGDKLEFDVKRLQEKTSVLQQDKERLTEELKSSQDLYNDLVCTRNSAVSDVPVNLQTGSNFELMSLPPEARERILRLQHENQQLKAQASSGEDSQLLRSLLDDTNVHKHELECQVRSLNHRVLELEANLNDLNEVQQKKSETDVAASSEVRKRLTEQLDRCRHLEMELQKQQQLVEELENKFQASNFTISELKAEIGRKELEVKETEEKYKKYLKKAETLLRHQIDPKVAAQSPTAPELSAVRSQLENKDQYLKLIEQENEKIKSTRDLEEKLMVTAWYNLTTSLHRKASEDRLTALSTSGSNSPQSFLARQRQVHIRRAPAANSSPVVLPNTAR